MSFHAIKDISDVINSEGLQLEIVQSPVFNTGIINQTFIKAKFLEGQRQIFAPTNPIILEIFFNGRLKVKELFLLQKDKFFALGIDTRTKKVLYDTNLHADVINHIFHAENYFHEFSEGMTVTDPFNNVMPVIKRSFPANGLKKYPNRFNNRQTWTDTYLDATNTGSDINSINITFQSIDGIADLINSEGARLSLKKKVQTNTNNPEIYVMTSCLGEKFNIYAKVNDAALEMFFQGRISIKELFLLRIDEPYIMEKLLHDPETTQQWEAIGDENFRDKVLDQIDFDTENYTKLSTGMRLENPLMVELPIIRELCNKFPVLPRNTMYARDWIRENL